MCNFSLLPASLDIPRGVLKAGVQIWCLNMKYIEAKTLPVTSYSLSSGHMDPYTNYGI